MTQTRGPQQRKARTRQSLIDAAARLFAERDADRTTVDEIAEAAGVSVGSLYVHFGSKEALLLAIVAETIAINERYMTNAELSASPLQRVLDAGDWYFRFAMEEPVAFRFINMRAPAATDADAALAEPDQRIADRVQHMVASIASDLAQAMEAGEIDAVPIDEAMVFLWGTWNGVAGLVQRPDQLAISPELAERALQRGRAVLIRGLGGQATRAE